MSGAGENSAPIFPLECEYVGVRDGVCVVRLGSTYLQSPSSDATLLQSACAHPQDRSGFLRQLDADDLQSLGTAHAFFDGKWQAMLSASVTAPKAKRIRLQLTLFPTSAVRPIASGVGVLAFNRFAAAVIAVGLLTLLAFRPDVNVAKASPWLALALTFVGAIIHEFGHAAACARAGVAPGRIGLGLYLIFPVAFSDVTHAWRASRRERVLVNLGGIYLQAAFLILVNLVNWRGVLGDLSAFNLLSVFLMIHALNPCFRSDGFWLLADLTGQPNPHRRLSELLSQAPASWSRLDIVSALAIGIAFVVYSTYVIGFMVAEHLMGIGARVGAAWTTADVVGSIAQGLLIAFGLFILFVLCRPVIRRLGLRHASS